MKRKRRSRETNEPRHPGWVVAGVSVVATVLWGLFGYSGDSIFGNAFPTFLGACERLKQAGIGPNSSDWFCQLSIGHIHVRFAESGLLIVAGLVITGMILAATGRRLSAFIPLGAAIVFDLGMLQVRWNQMPNQTFLQRHWLVACGVALVLLAAPVVAVMRTKDRPRVTRSIGRRWPTVAAAVVCGLGVAVCVYWVRSLLDFGVDNSFLPKPLIGHFVAIGLFGALLGTNRKWWPWVLAPVAVLLSQGPSALYILTWEPGVSVRTPFGLVLPLFVAGLIGSAWQPLTGWLSKRTHRAEGDVSAAAAPPAIDRRRLRVAVVLNAAAAGLLVFSVLMYQSDTFPQHLTQPLPTYLGLRNAANDLRTKMDLEQAMAAMDAFHSKKGTYQGFTAAVGRQLDPTLAWQDGLPTASTDSYGGSALTMAIVWHSKNLARVASGSESGRAFCLQDTKSGGMTYGTSETGDEAAAISQCASTPWTSAAVQPLPPIKCPVETSGYLICRMVQALIVKIMSDPAPDPMLRAIPPLGGAVPVLVEGQPMFIVRHFDGSSSIVSGISSHKPWGIGELVSWCPSTRTFQDLARGSIFDEYGRYATGPAPTGLGRFEALSNSEWPGSVDVGQALVPFPRTAGSTATRFTPACTAKNDVPAMNGDVVPAPTPREGMSRAGIGNWGQFDGRLVVSKNGPASVCAPSDVAGACEDPIPVAGIDPHVVDSTGKRTYVLDGTWLAQVTDEGFSNLTFVG